MPRPYRIESFSQRPKPLDADEMKCQTFAGPSRLTITQQWCPTVGLAPYGKGEEFHHKRINRDEERLAQEAHREFLKGGTAEDRKMDQAPGYRYKYQKYVKEIEARNKNIDNWSDDGNEVRFTLSLT